MIIAFIFKAEAQTSASNRADSLYALGNYTQAINEYAKEPNEYCKLQIGRAYNAIGNYDKAIKQYEALVEEYPSLENPRFELGKLYLKTNKAQWAAEQFFDLTLDHTNNPEYPYYLGMALFELGSIKESVLNFKSAFRMDSTHLRSIFQLGKYYVTKQEKDSVLLFVDHGLDFYPNDVALINLKALALFNNAEYEKAGIFFEKLLELGEIKPHIYEKLGQCYNMLREFQKAKEAYNELTSFDEFIPEAYYGLGNVYWKEKKLDSASIFFKKAIDAKKPNLAGEYGALADLARESGDLKNALNYYELAFREDETNFRVYYQICTMVDQLSQDSKIKLGYYEGVLEKFGTKIPYFSDFAKKRISELKSEIHFKND